MSMRGFIFDPPIGMTDFTTLITQGSVISLKVICLHAVDVVFRWIPCMWAVVANDARNSAVSAGIAKQSGAGGNLRTMALGTSGLL